jgi:tetratricopeptide (TPR) repeat protein
MTTARVRAPRSIERLACALAILAAACGEPPPRAPASPAAKPAPPPTLERAAALEAEARQLLDLGVIGGAERAALEAGRLFQQLRGPRHPDTGRVAELFASIKLRRGDRAAAEQALLAALAVREAEAGPSAPRVAEVLDRLAEAVGPSVPERVIPYLQRALAIRKAALGPEHPEVARTLTALGATLLKSCRAAEAESALREALAIAERTGGSSVVEPLEKLSEARWQANDDPGSEQLLARAAAVLEPLEATEAEALSRVLRALAAKERARKDYTAAAAHGERAVVAARSSQSLVDAADGLGETYRAQGNEAAAAALFQRLSLLERVLPPGAAATVPGAAPHPPAARCTPPSAPAPGGAVANAGAVIAGLASGFRRCYNRALQRDPEMKGSIRITAKVGPGGEVVRVRTLTPASYAEVMVTCPMQRLLEARFTPPEGGGATVVVPVTFVSQ